MDILHSFFIKIFCSFMLVFCCAMHNTFAAQIKLCGNRKNYYVAKCGDVTIGTNILKGYSGGGFNYYDYSETDNSNLKNMRFFLNDIDGRPPLQYTKYDGSQAIAYGVEYVANRQALLERICNPVNQSESFFTCLPCPNGGNVNTSKVTISDGQVVPSSWNFYTFADCHKQSFSDSTGSYVYMDNSTPEKCYYNQEVQGDVITLILDDIEENASVSEASLEVN